MDSDINLSSSACQHCREQKLRCSKELSACTRCNKFGLDCSYPKPPDRKRIAQTRARPSKRRIPSMARVREIIDGQVSSSKQFGLIPDSFRLSSQYGDLQITHKLHSFMVDIFFDNILDSVLLFDKEGFSTRIANGEYPLYLRLAMYSLATIFMDSSTVCARQSTFETIPNNSYKLQGKEWAEQAGLQCLVGINSPSVSQAQACHLLGHYWFSQGDVMQSTMFSGIASQASCSIIRDFCKEHKASWSEHDMRYRIFWASFIAYCCYNDHCMPDSFFGRFVLRIPLPSLGNHSWSRENGKPQTLLDRANEQFGSLGRSTIDIWPSTIKLVYHWNKIKSHIEECNRNADLSDDNNVSNLRTEALLLDDWLVSFGRVTGIDHQCSEERLMSLPRDKDLSNTILLHCLYHQCRLTLQTSLISTLLIPDDDLTNSRWAGVSHMNFALDSANAISKLAVAILSSDVDIASLSPMVGYCMYTAAVLYLDRLAQSNGVSQMDWQHFIPAFKVLQDMRLYWSILETQWRHLHVLFESQIPRFLCSLASPSVLRGHTRNIEEWAKQNYETQKLMSPFCPFGSVNSRSDDTENSSSVGRASLEALTCSLSSTFSDVQYQPYDESESSISPNSNKSSLDSLGGSQELGIEDTSDLSAVGVLSVEHEFGRANETAGRTTPSSGWLEDWSANDENLFNTINHR